MVDIGENDPTDHARTTMPRAGEAMKDAAGLYGYALLGLAILAFVACLTAGAMGYHGWMVVAGVVALVSVAGGAVRVYARRRHIARLAYQPRPSSQEHGEVDHRSH
jgi:hypothetical protein